MTQLDMVFSAACSFFWVCSSFLCIFTMQCAALSLLVLHAMRDDSEKVPALLTDYILKGKRTAFPLITFICFPTRLI